MDITGLRLFVFQTRTRDDRALLFHNCRARFFVPGAEILPIPLSQKELYFFGLDFFRFFAVLVQFEKIWSCLLVGITNAFTQLLNYLNLIPKTVEKNERIEIKTIIALFIA